jgi:hypothetical protein
MSHPINLQCSTSYQCLCLQCLWSEYDSRRRYSSGQSKLSDNSNRQIFPFTEASPICLGFSKALRGGLVVSIRQFNSPNSGTVRSLGRDCYTSVSHSRFRLTPVTTRLRSPRSLKATRKISSVTEGFSNDIVWNLLPPISAPSERVCATTRPAGTF